MTNLSVSELALPARLWLARGKQALQARKRDEAVAAFRRAVSADPNHIDSWLWLAGFCDDPHESLRCLAQVLELDPQNEAAHEGIRWARKRLSATGEPAAGAEPGSHVSAAGGPHARGVGEAGSLTPSASPAEPAPREPAPHPAIPHILRSALVLLLLFLALGGGSISFWAAPLAVASAAPSESALDMSVSAPLADFASNALPSFAPFSEPVQRDLQYQLDYDKGAELRAQDDLHGALLAFQAAVNLDPNAIEARSELAQVKADLDARTGAPAPASPAVLAAKGAKWIDVNLTTQHFRAMRGQTVVYSLPASTGVPGSATVPGHFKILDKIPNAYSFMWKLKMPYWMGIYWAGKAENGIHALPINRKGQKIWGNLLGRPSSFGCVILDTKAAGTIFNWADIGTPLIIHY